MTPRDERREIRFGRHAIARLDRRNVDIALAEAIVRAGATRPDADCDFLAYGTGAGNRIECACLDRGDHIFVKTVYLY